MGRDGLTEQDKISGIIIIIIIITIIIIIKIIIHRRCL